MIRSAMFAPVSYLEWEHDGARQAQAQKDWLVGKNLSLAPVVKGLKEPTYVAGPPDGSKPREVLKRPDWLQEIDHQMR